jgi:Uncharacterized protein conserved in bacteria (DUF2125)
MENFQRKGFVMKQWTFATSTAVAALMIGQAAFADVTPEEIWQNWQDMSASAGQTITAESAERDGDTLTLTNVAVGFDDAAGGKMSGTIAEIDLTDNGDGSVDITMSEAYQLTLATPAKDAMPAQTININVTQKDMVLTAAGTIEETSYDYTAGQMDIKVDATPEGGTAPELTADIGFTNASGGYVISGEEGAKSLDSNVAADSMKITLDGADAAAGSTFKMQADMADVAIDTAGMFLASEAMANMGQALKDGFNTQVDMSYGATTSTIDVTDASGPSKIGVAATSGGFNVVLGADGLVYGANGMGVAMTMSGAQIPFPELKVGFGEAAFNLVMPVMAGDAPADFELLSKLVDFTISDEIWAMVDPTNQLPRDPATIIFDTKGTAKLTTDIMDEAAMAALGDAPPGELNSLDITEVRASVGGAELTGAGAFTFDNTDMTTFQGMPAPTGKIDLKLTGGNGLLDKLAAMGLVPEDQVGMIRMMSGMFTVPSTDGSDSLTSTVEFKDKAMLINGNAMPM